MVQRNILQEPPVSLGEESEDPYHFDESDESDDGCSRRIGPLYLRMEIDDDIADAAGIETPAKGKGKQRERQVAPNTTKFY